MAKKITTAVATVEAKTDNVVRFDSAADISVLAAGLGIDVSGTLDERANLAAEHMNRSQRHMLASGLLLASIKAECEHGQFAAIIEERGFEERAARRAMQYAEFVLSRPEADRIRLVGMPKSKVLALAGADPEVVEALLNDRDSCSVDALSVRDLNQRIRDLEKNAKTQETNLDIANQKVQALESQLGGAARVRADNVPHVVARLRQELLALRHKALLSVESIRALGVDLVQLPGSEAGAEWGEATLRMAVSSLADLALQIDGALRYYTEAMPGLDVKAMPALMVLSPQEAAELAEQLRTAVAAHELEANNRAVIGENQRKKAEGLPGRPLKVAAAPKAARTSYKQKRGGK